MSHAIENFVLSGVVLFIIVVIFLCVGAVQSASPARIARADAQVQIAVDIAKNQGWVSRYRLVQQTNMNKDEAFMVLTDACRRGLLVYQASNRRYYLPSPDAPPPAAIS